MRPASLSSEELRGLKTLLDSMPPLEPVLAAAARAGIPGAARLALVLFGNAAPATASRKVFLGAGASGDDGPAPTKQDLGGHLMAQYDGAPQNCLRCTATLLAAGDYYSADSSPGTFAPSERHTAAQRYVLAHPGVRYLEALQRTEEGT